jgi:hypothetical protein
MAHRINERNTGHWSLDGEPKHVKPKRKKVTRTFSEGEISFSHKMVKSGGKHAHDIRVKIRN